MSNIASFVEQLSPAQTNESSSVSYIVCGNKVFEVEVIERPVIGL